MCTIVLHGSSCTGVYNGSKAITYFQLIQHTHIQIKEKTSKKDLYAYIIVIFRKFKKKQIQYKWVASEPKLKRREVILINI